MNKTVTVHAPHGVTYEQNVVPVKPEGEVHIFIGACGYKLSIGERHLTLAELAYVVDKINAIHIADELYGAKK